MTTRELLHSLAELLADRIEGTDDREYYDQSNSPLPAEVHTRLVRAGKLTGYKVGGRVLVKRAELHAFIESHRVQPTAGVGSGSEEDAVAELLRQCKERRGHAA